MAQVHPWTTPDDDGVDELLRLADRLCFLLDVSCDRHRPCGWPARACPYCQAVDDWRATRLRRPYAVS